MHPAQSILYTAQYLLHTTYFCTIHATYHCALFTIVFHPSFSDLLSAKFFLHSVYTIGYNAECILYKDYCIQLPQATVEFILYNTYCIYDTV